MANDTQLQFDRRYITTGEIMRKLGISRSSVHMARVAGRLPDAVDVQGHTFIWERAAITPYLDAWHTVIKARRGY